MVAFEAIKDKLFSESHSFRVTGLDVKSFVICDRQLYFKKMGFQIETDLVVIQKGTDIAESSYKRQKSKTEIIDGMISPDFFEENKIVEVKKSSGGLDASLAQLKYYLWYVNEKFGLKYDGELRVPKENEIYEVEYDSSVRDEVKEIIQTIYIDYEKNGLKSIPKFEKKSVCSSCAYKDICWLSSTQ